MAALGKVYPHYVIDEVNCTIVCGVSEVMSCWQC